MIETLLVYSDSFLNIEKSKIFARLFRNHLDGYYDWTYFLGLTDCLNSINISAIDFWTQMADINYEISEKPEERKIERDGDKEALLYSCGIAYEKSG